jgi:hypothetical protein
MTIGKTMVFNRIALLILLGLSSCASQRSQISSVELRNHVNWLAADEQEGRAAGSPAAARSAVYLTRHLDAAGLIPAGDNGTYFQHFDIPAPAIEGASTLTIGDEIFDVTTLSASPAETHNAALVFADTDDVEGKIVLMKSDGEIRAEVREAAANGAVAVILRAMKPLLLTQCQASCPSLWLSLISSTMRALRLMCLTMLCKLKLKQISKSKRNVRVTY